ncbi:MAG: RHS repeat-associated core domain-containing protein [Lentisphaeria bacterium]
MQSGFTSRLFMVDANGNQVTSSPAYYDCIFAKTGVIRYDASTYAMVSVTSNEGKTYTTPESAGIEILRDASDNLRQIRSATDGLADLVTTGTQSYEIRLYPPPQAGAKDTSGFYVPTGQPVKKWLIENPSSSTTNLNQVRVTELTTTSTHVGLWIYSPTNKDWEFSEASGVRHHRKIRNDDRTQALAVIQNDLLDNSNNLQQRKIEKFKLVGWGELPLTTAIDPAGLNLVTSYAFYETSTDTARFAREKYVQNPDGSWMFHDYNSGGYKQLDVSPWLDTALTGTAAASTLAAANVAVTTSYTPVDANDTLTMGDARPRTVEEAVQGVTTARTWSAYYTSTAGERIEVFERAATSTAAYGATGNLRTLSTHYSSTDSNVAAATRLKSVLRPDNTLDSYSYEAGDWADNTSDPSSAAFTATSTGQAFRTTIVHGTAAHPDGIANQTGKDIVVEDAYGNEVLAETYVYTGSGYERVSWTVKRYDGQHHLTAAVSSGNAQFDATWDADHKLSETAPDGASYTFTYDALGRLSSKTRQGVTGQADRTISYTYNVLDKILTETVSGGILSQVTTHVYDAAGRLTQTTDPAGLVTATAYELGGRRTIVTLPSGATKITENYIDGRLKSVTGTAVVAEYHTYGVNGDGTRWHTVRTGAADSALYETTTTDLLGRVIRVEKPAFGGGTTVTTNGYNALGQLVRTETRDGNGALLAAPTLNEYDELGQLVRTGLDVTGNGALDLASADRITEREAVFEKDAANIWWAAFNTRAYNQTGSATPVTVATTRLQLSGLGGTQSDGFTLAALAKARDVYGNETVSQTLVNRAAKTTKTVTTQPSSTVPATMVTVNGLTTSATSASAVTTTYGYDSLGRPTAETDARTGTAITHWNSLGQVDYVQDAAGAQTSFTYDATSGYRIATTNALGNPAYTAYNARGQITRTWGGAAYPVEFVYDAYGRQTQLKTFRTTATGTDFPATTPDITTSAYDAATGFLTSKTDAAGKAVTYTYDALGRLATRTWARGTVTTYTYDASTGDRTAIAYSDTATPGAAYTYDRLGRLLTAARSGLSSVAYAYDTATLGLLTETYGAFLGNRVLTRTRDTAVVIGRDTGFELSSGLNLELKDAYAYDTYGRPAAVTASSAHFATATIQYAYAANSDLLAATTFPSASGLVTTRDYETSRDLLAEIRHTAGQNLLAGVAYTNDALGRRTQATRAGSAYAALGFTSTGTVAYAYNSRDEVTGATASNAALTGYDYAFAYDTIGNRQTRTRDSATEEYTANALNQYTQRTVPGAFTLTGTAAPAAVVTAVAPATATAATPAAFHRATRPQSDAWWRADLTLSNTAAPVALDYKVVGVLSGVGANGEDAVEEQAGHLFIPQTPEAFTYDDDGNLLTDGRWSYTWDAENRLAAMETQSGSGVSPLTRLEFAYDHLSRRIGKKVYTGAPGAWTPQSETRFLYHGFRLVAAYAVDAATSSLTLARTCTWGANGEPLAVADIATGAVYACCLDGNRNVIALANLADGTLAAAYEYGPFGEVTAQAGPAAAANPVRFSSEYADTETGLVYYNYRYYSPALGRWLARDPIGELGGLNLYWFCGNDPVNGADVLGLSSISPSLEFGTGNPYAPNLDLSGVAGGAVHFADGVTFHAINGLHAYATTNYQGAEYAWSNKIGGYTVAAELAAVTGFGAAGALALSEIQAAMAASPYATALLGAGGSTYLLGSAAQNAGAMAGNLSAGNYCNAADNTGILLVYGAGGLGGLADGIMGGAVNAPSNPVFKTWNEFQSGTAGQFATRAEAGQAWTAYKQANGIASSQVVRSATARSQYLKSLVDDYRTPSWMKQWLKKGRTPPGYEVDHIKPLSIGGADTPANMRFQSGELHDMWHKQYDPWNW